MPNHGSRFLKALVPPVLAVLASSPVLHGQAVSVASVTGRVVDTQSAVIANAQVTMTSTDTGGMHTGQTNQDGIYTITNLPVGKYRLEVSAPQGFQKYVQNGIELRVNDNVQINVTLTIGSTSQTVVVEANASLVQTQQNNISQVIDQRRIVELPLNGRDPTQLITISGAAVNHTDGTNTGSKSFLTAQSIAVAGGAGDQTNYLLDGGDNNDSFTNVNLPFPFPDALQEFSVETNSLPARNGLHPGGLVNAVTKSGTNQWHGSAFEFLRNYKLNAINYFAPRQDSLKRNQFGGTFGGHIIRDKLFFFGGYQSSRIRQDPSSTTAFVPTAAALSGDFSGLESAGCQSNKLPRTIKDPATGVTIANNHVDPARFDPASVKLAAYLPTTTDPCGKVLFGTPVQSDETQYITRVDFNLNSKNTIYGRYFYDNYNLAAFFDPKDILVTATSGNDQRVQSFALGETFTITPNLINAFHSSFSRRRINRGPNANGINANTLGVNNLYQGTKNYLQLSVTNGGFAIGSGTGALGIFNVNSFQEADDIDWIHGKHQFAFGVDIIRLQNNSNSHFEDNGWFQFSGQYSNDPLLDFLTGYMNKYEQTMPQQIAFRQTVPGLYAQDTFHITPKLVMNAGLRWEPTLYQYDIFHRGSAFSRSAFDGGQVSQVFTSAPAGMLFYGDQGVPAAFTKNTYTNFSPRLGFVYNPDGQGKTVVRVGGGFLHDSLGTYLTYRVTANNLPYGITVSNQSGPYQFSSPWTNVPGGNPFPLPFSPPKNFVFPQSASQVILPSQIRPVTMGQWNLGLQHQFSANWVFSISYLGNRTYNMLLGNEVNPAVYIPGTWTGPGSCGALTISPGTGKACSSTANTQNRRVLALANPAIGKYYGQQTLTYDRGFGNYNGMLASVEHRFSHNYTVLANYTWSKCMHIGPINSIGIEGVIQNPSNPRSDYGPCTYDATNIFNLSGVVTSGFKFENHVLSAIVNNWELAPLFRFQTGLPITPMSGIDNSLTGIGVDRADPTGQDPYQNTGHTTALYQYLNPNAYVVNPVGTFGTAGRGSLRAPSYADMDASVSRNFNVTERLKLTLRFEAFNALNHPNFNGPNTSKSSSSFGKITSTQDPRLMQGAIKVTF